jgi:hypothetical protein
MCSLTLMSAVHYATLIAHHVPESTQMSAAVLMQVLGGLSAAGWCCCAACSWCTDTACRQLRAGPDAGGADAAALCIIPLSGTALCTVNRLLCC